MIAQVDVQIACDDEELPESNEIESWLQRAIDAAGKNVADEVEVLVRIVGCAESRALNREYRQQDKPTNVLSFPTGRIEGLPADMSKMLGDIVICASIVNQEAAEQGKPGDEHWAHMVVHGTLHLLGFDHTDDDGALEMEGLETRILTTHGVADPYGESHQRPDTI